MEIRIDKLDSREVIELLNDHLVSMAPTAPAESLHALDINGLRKPEISFWSIWDGERLAGIGALKKLSDEHAEIKSMKTASSYLRKGVASTMLRHILKEVKTCGYSRLSLETGSMDYFIPARNLYLSYGFVKCRPFAEYKDDPNSTFMTMIIKNELD